MKSECHYCDKNIIVTKKDVVISKKFAKIKRENSLQIINFLITKKVRYHDEKFVT